MTASTIHARADKSPALKWVLKAIFIAILPMALVLSHAQAQAPHDAAGRVMFVVGKATKQNENGATQAIAKDMTIWQGDKLVTAADGYIYTRMSDGALLVIRPESTLSVDLWRYDANKPENSQIKYTLHNGLSRYVSGRGSQAAKEQFRFNTPLAAIGVRGTDFTVWTRADLTEVSVRSGGVVVSGFGANCEKNALGPCEGRTAAELFANRSSGYLQLKAGEQRPQLMPANGRSGPDQNMPPLTNEPTAKDDKTGGAHATVLALKNELRAEDVVAKLAVQKPEGPPPLAAWGRWGDIAVAADRDRIVNSLLEGRELLAINSFYLLARNPGLSHPLPETGIGNFKLVEHDGIVINPQTGKAEATKALDGNLRIDFAKQRFQTDLKLDAMGQTVQIASTGKVESGGTLRSDPFVSTTTVQGLVGGTAAGQAVYIYRQPGTFGHELSGATNWSR